MPDLYIFNDKIESIFQLLGTKENDMSYSVGYALANCRQFLHKLLKHLNIQVSFQSDEVKVRLQKHEKGKGFTDFEIICDGAFHLIIEAKRGWTFPSKAQLEKYVARQSFVNSSAKEKRVIIFNESNAGFTQTHFGIDAIMGVPVSVVSWHQLQRLADASIVQGRVSENRLVRELAIYLEKNSTMQKIDSNWVYVVSLGSSKLDSSSITWQQIVNNYHLYFHPVGGGRGGWPTEPPNYIAFRYNGKLQSIHHIDSYEVFTDPSIYIPEISSRTWERHYLYHLGPAMRPSQEVKAGKRITQSLRVWAMLDLLLTSESIEQARDASNKREQAKT